MTGGRSKGKYGQTHRVLRALDILRSRRAPFALASLAEELGVTERQARRDVQVLAEAGHPVEWSLLQGRSALRLERVEAKPLTLSVRERFALLAVRRVFRVLEGTPLAVDAAAVFDKVAASLPADKAESLRALEPAFAYVPDGGVKPIPRKQADTLDALLTGALQRRPVDVRYRSSRGHKRECVLEPWGVALYRHALYVVGRIDAEAEPRVLAVERFDAATCRRGQRFEVPDGFTVDGFFEGSFGVWVGKSTERIVIDIAPGAAAEIAKTRRWHRSQKRTRLPDGGVRLTFETVVGPDVASWVLAWGPAATVKEPASLVERVKAELDAARSRYG